MCYHYFRTFSKKTESKHTHAHTLKWRKSIWLQGRTVLRQSSKRALTSFMYYVLYVLMSCLYFSDTPNDWHYKMIKTVAALKTTRKTIFFYLIQQERQEKRKHNTSVIASFLTSVERDTYNTNTWSTLSPALKGQGTRNSKQLPVGQNHTVILQVNWIYVWNVDPKNLFSNTIWVV